MLVNNLQSAAQKEKQMWTKSENQNPKLLTGIHQTNC